MLAIIDYGAGNLTSVKLAFEALRIEATITGAADEIRAAERVVFPGVGAAGAAMRNLAAQGLVEVIRELPRRGIPFLGICLGTQILLTRSDEDGGVDALGIIPGRVKRFAPTSRYEKVPQMGWNGVHQTQAHPVFDGIADQSEFYFVHSYYPAPDSVGHVLGTTTYAGVRFASAVAAGSVVATQFHVEKSGRVGLRFLENFCRWQPGNGDA
jgi:imidazole glycerol-phosphate synthase subunit HisH